MSDTAVPQEKTYLWEDSSPISRIDVRGNGVAYIHASNHAEGLPELRSQFEEKGWATSPDTRNNDDNALRVSGFDDIREVTDILQTARAVQGEPQIVAVVPDKKSAKDRLKSGTLSAAGKAFLAGDILYGTAGIVRKDPLVGFGAFSFVGDTLLMTYGRHDDKRQFASLLRKLEKHYKENGIPVSQNSALSIETAAMQSKQSDKVQDFLRENANPIKLLLGITSGSFMMKAGWGKEGDPTNMRNPYRIAAGACIVSGYIASLLIKEKKLDPEKYEKAGGLEKTWMRLQARPLQAASYLSLANNSLFVASIIRKWKERVPDVGALNYLWREAGAADIAGVSAMVVGNLLYSISKKTTGGDIKSTAITDDVYGLAAQVLDNLPEQSREAAIMQTAEYLGDRAEINDNRKTVEARLRNEVKALRSNPWFITEGRQAGNTREKIDSARGA